MGGETERDDGQAVGDRFEPATESVMPETRVARVHLVRHAEVARFAQRTVRGQLEVPLTERAPIQERALVEHLALVEPRPDRILSSDLERCRSLARQVQARYGLEVEYDPDLREQSMGAWEGRTWEELTEREPDLVSAYWNDYAHTRPPEGEALTDLSQRVGDWWDANLEHALDRSTIVVTHVGVIRVLLARLLHLPLGDALRLAPAVASHTTVLWSAAGPVLETFGERPWLHALESESGTTR
ncbi:MAG: histidine phosphatase family protein [Planctomycetota bacterium]|jgi:broad specificity phosphatase PhoE